LGTIRVSSETARSYTSAKLLSSLSDISDKSLPKRGSDVIRYVADEHMENSGVA